MPMFPLDVHAASAYLDQPVFVDTDTPSDCRARVSRQDTQLETTRYLEKSQRSASDVFQKFWFSNWEFQSSERNVSKVFVESPEPGEVDFPGSDAGQARGKTLRDLSRLWKYANGGVPDDRGNLG